VSLLYFLEDGSCTEVALAGREGVVGIALFMGGGGTPSRAVVQVAGHALRLRAAQMTQTAVCNRHHAVDQQVCRWLLLALDRLDTSELHMTQEHIAQLLGVRREGVTEAAGKLQAAGLIEYSRGRTACSTAAGWRSGPASATRRCGASTSGCCRRRSRLRLLGNRRIPAGRPGLRAQLAHGEGRSHEQHREERGDERGEPLQPARFNVARRRRSGRK
jgi:hypothetical protein